MYPFHYFYSIPRRSTTKIFFSLQRWDGKTQNRKKDNSSVFVFLYHFLSFPSNYKTAHKIEGFFYLFCLNKFSGLRYFSYLKEKKMTREKSKDEDAEKKKTMPRICSCNSTNFFLRIVIG